MKAIFCPRFSLRTLAIVVTLACLYVRAWEATKTYGVPIAALRDPFSSVQDARSPMPCIVSQDKLEYLGVRSGLSVRRLIKRRTYYVWFIGLKCKLPFDVTR